MGQIWRSRRLGEDSRVCWCEAIEAHAQRGADSTSQRPSFVHRSISVRDLIPAQRRPCGLEECVLLVGEDPRARQEAHTLGGFEREAAAAPRHDVDGEVRVLPVLELLKPDEDRRAGNLAEIDVLRPDAHLAAWVAHRRGAVAAAATLMNEQRPVHRFERAQHHNRRVGDIDAADRGSCGRGLAQKKPSAFVL